MFTFSVKRYIMKKRTKKCEEEGTDFLIQLDQYLMSRIRVADILTSKDHEQGNSNVISDIFLGGLWQWGRETLKYSCKCKYQEGRIILRISQIWDRIFKSWF